jgi:hypothetical protein
MSNLKVIYEILMLRLKKLDNPVCPSKINVSFASIPYTNNRVICLDYERSRFSERVPSKRYCPDCKYNGDKLRKDSDKELKKGIVELVQKVV